MRRLRTLLREQRGISLIMAMGILGVLSMTGVTLVTYASTNARTAEFSRHDERAFDLAEAGLSEAFAVLFQPTNDAMWPYLLPETTRTYGTDTVKWKGTFDDTVAPVVWHVTSTASVKNPTGPSARPVTRTLKADVPVVPRPSQPLANQAWNFVFSTNTVDPSCDLTIANSTIFTSPMYVMGDLCLDGSAQIQGNGPVFVRGTVSNISPTNSIGMSTAPIPAWSDGQSGVRIGGGCSYKKSAFSTPCTSAHQVFASPAALTGSANVPNLTAPFVTTTELDTWYLHASPGPYFPCKTQTGSPPVFENQTVNYASPNAANRNRSNPSQAQLTPASAYTCKTNSGELSWTPGTSSTPGQLKVQGTIFIDGDVAIQSASMVKYSGHGSIWASGSILLKNTKICAKTLASDPMSCDWANWDTNADMLTLVATGVGGSSVPVDVSTYLSSIHFQGAIYGGPKLEVGSASTAAGPLVAQKLLFSNNMTWYGFMHIDEVPTATPGQPIVFGEPKTPMDFGG